MTGTWKFMPGVLEPTWYLTIRGRPVQFVKWSGRWLIRDAHGEYRVALPGEVPACVVDALDTREAA